jgi:threonyl-tRNA synthetase
MLDPSDHREIGRKLDLFHFQEEAPGMVFWHPKGLLLFRILEGIIARHVRRDGFSEVRTPQLLRLPVWETSGHLRHAGHMFVFRGESEAESFAIKPVSCPGHIEIFKRRAPSYRELPVRYAELGVVHRDEPSGTLHGLFRLRQFTQDDGHIFCADEHIEAEIARFASSLLKLYSALGFGALKVAFASRPDDRAGSDQSWDRAERLLQSAAEKADLVLDPAPKSGAFYGPKLEFSLADRLGRAWQCGTIQLDLLLPERFGAEYVGRSGARERPLLLHRATFGSLERFLGILLEQHEGKLPLWLAPDQVIVLPVAPSDQEYAERVAGAFAAAGVRAAIERADETLARRIVAAHEASAPYVAVVGAREASAESVNLRHAGEQRPLPLARALAEIAPGCQPPV